jgi:hypothetical protein
MLERSGSDEVRYDLNYSIYKGNIKCIKNTSSSPLSLNKSLVFMWYDMQFWLVHFYEHKYEKRGIHVKIATIIRPAQIQASDCNHAKSLTID